MDQVDFFYFKDWVKFITENSLDEWIVVYFNSTKPEEDCGIYCGLLRNSVIDHALQQARWELNSSIPRHYTVDYENSEEYYHYLNEAIIEKQQLIVKRNFFGKEESYIEVSEEFRYYFNLFFDQKLNCYFFIDEVGDADEVIKVSKEEVKIKLKYIKEFITVKDMSLVLFYEIMRFSQKNLSQLGIQEYDKKFNGEKFFYSIYIRDWDCGYNRVSQAWFIGKKVISGFKNFNQNKIYALEYRNVDFIIGVDEDGLEVYSDLNNPDKKFNDFQLVYFKKSVLSKYYNSSLYLVGDGYVECKGGWYLNIDNNMSNHVAVFLEDFKSIPYKEKLYWKSYNVIPQKFLSSTAYKRQIEGEFCDSEKPDLYFKSLFLDIQKKWYEKFKWYLFKPLGKDDQHYFDSLRIPLSSEQREFDEQILGITKIFIDSLNEEKLQKFGKLDQTLVRGIDKFEGFLKAHNIVLPKMIEFLRKLQNLRSSSAAHRKGKNYEVVKKYFEMDVLSLDEVFANILIKLIWILNGLKKDFLKK